MYVHSILLPVLLPLGLGLLALLVPGRLRGLRAAIGVLGALAAFVSGLAIAGGRSTAGWEGFRLLGLDLDLLFRSDAFSSWAVAFVGLMAVAAALYAVGWYRSRGGAPGGYYAWLLLATGGANGVLLADNLLLLLVAWEIVTLALFLFVISGRESAGEGAAKAFAMLGLGDLALLLGVLIIGMIQTEAGVDRPLSVHALAAAPLTTGSIQGGIAYVLLLLAAMAKAGAMPVHSWIPTMSTETHAGVMAFLPGSLDKILGIFLLVRISLDWFVPTAGLRMLVMLVGVLTMLGAVFMAMLQHDLRRLLSFHAVSQVGYMLLGIGTGTIIGVLGGVFHMVNHAIYKACLFLGAGEVERETGTMELGRLGGLVKTFPITFGCMFVAALAISGIPPLNGFVSKWLVYESCVAAEVPIFLIAALFASALTLASFVKVLHSVFWGPRPARLDGVTEEKSLGVQLPMVVLAVLCVTLGLFAAAPLDQWIGPAAGLEADGAIRGSDALAGVKATWEPVGSPTDSTAAVERAFDLGTFRPLSVTGLLLFGVLVALFVGYLGNLRTRRVRSVFVGGEAIDRNIHRFSGTEFYRTIQELPGLGRLLEAGERGQLDLYEAGKRTGRPLVAALRRLHTGLISDYLVWSMAGLAVLFAVLLFGR